MQLIVFTTPCSADFLSLHSNHPREWYNKHSRAGAIPRWDFPFRSQPFQQHVMRAASAAESARLLVMTAIVHVRFVPDG